MASFSSFWDSLKAGIKAGYKSATAGSEADDTQEGTLKMSSDGELVNVVPEEESLLKEGDLFGTVAGKLLGGAWGAIEPLWNIAYDHLSADKQDIDRELYGLKYGNEAVLTDEGKANYVRTLYQYDQLYNKDKLTPEEMGTLAHLSDELDKYTVAERPHNLLSLWANTFWFDSDRSRKFLGPEYARTKVNTKEILNNIDTQTKRIFGITDAPDTKGIRTMTTKEYEDLETIDKRRNDKMKEVAQDMINKGYVASRNPGGRDSTIDEVLGDLESELADRSFAINMETYKEGLHLTKDRMSVIHDAIEKDDNGLIELAGHILTYKGTPEEAYMDYLKDHDNPFILDLEKLKDGELSEYERSLINESYLGRVGDIFRDTDTDPYYGADAASMIDQLKRLDNYNQNYINYKNGANLFTEEVKGLWNLVAYGSSVLGGYMSSALGAGLMASEAISRAFVPYEGEDRLASYEDLHDYYFGWQNSTILSSKWNHQNAYAPKDIWGDMANFSTTYISMVDDFATAYLEGQLFNFPVKTAEVGKLAKIIVAGTKATKKAEKAAEGTKTIITAGEKINGLAKGESYMSRVKNGLTNYFKSKRDNNIRGLKALSELDKGTAIRLGSENLVRWVAEEALTSAAFQGLTPYDYTITDLGMDITGAMISGWMRAVSFNNNLGLVKLQGQDAGWVTWWFSDVYRDAKGNKLSEIEVKDKISKMSSTDIKELGQKIKEGVGVIGEDPQVVTRKEFMSKAQQIGIEARKGIDGFADNLIKKTEENLKLEFSRSRDRSVNSLVKKVRKKGADGKTYVTIEWNKKKDITPKEEKAFYKKVTEARNKLYGGETFDNLTTASKVRKYIKTESNYVKGHIAEILSRTGKRYLVKKVNGKWVFKDNVSKEDIEKLIKDETEKRLNKALGDRYNILKKGATEKLFGMEITPMNEMSGGPMTRWLASYVNNFIIRRKTNKNILVAGLKAMGGSVAAVFDQWIRKTYPEKKGIDDFTFHELVEAIKEFGRRYDEELFPDWNLNHRISNEDIGLMSPDQYLANHSFEEAKKQNPDLVYMGQNLFYEIVNDSQLTLVEKERKLRNWRRRSKGGEILAMEGDITGRSDGGTHFFGIDEKDNAGWGRRTFNDTYEEKKVFGTSGKIYLKVNEEDGSTIVAQHMKQDKPHPFYRKKEGVMECTYEKKEANPEDGHTTYFVYDKNKVMVAEITIISDVDFTNMKPPYRPENVFPKPRLMSIKLQGDLKDAGLSADFEVVKGKDAETKFFNTDIDLSIVEDTVFTKGEYKENGKVYKRQSTLRQWNEFSLFVRKGEKSYAAFRTLIPGYTDRVPEAYFNRVMYNSELSHVDKQNLLMAAMINKKVSISKDGIVLDAKGQTFNRGPIVRQEPVFDEKTHEYIGTQKVIVPGEGEMYRREFGKGTVLFTRDDGTVTAFDYEKGDNGLYILFKDPEHKKPVGVISIGDRDVKAYLTEGKKRVFASKIEMLNNQSLDLANKIVKERYDELPGNVKVPEGDNYYREIYKRLYGVDMPEDEYHKLRSTPNMTPERYLNTILMDFKQSRFGKYIKIKNGDWTSIIDQIKRGQDVTRQAEYFANKYKTDLNDGQIMQAVERVMHERAVNNGKITLTPQEKEIRDILYGKNKIIDNNDAEIVGVYGYSMFGIPPKKVSSTSLVRLKNRRDHILLALFRDRRILDLDDGQKELLMAWARRKGLLEWTEDQLIQDIFDHPEFYKGILGAFADTMKEMEEGIDDTADLARLREIETRLEELERDDANKKVYKKTGPNTSKIQKKIAEYQQGEVNNLLQQAEEEIQAAADSADERAMKAAYSKKSELEQYNKRVAEEKEYKDSKSVGEYSQEQFDYLARLRMKGQDTGIIREAPLSEAEVNDRIDHIIDKLPSKRIITVNPDGTITTRGFTNEEQLIYKDQIDSAAQAIRNNKANAAYVRELRAIVVDPTIMLSNTLGHEWFHEAISLMEDKRWTKGKIDNLFFDTYKKHSEDIDTFAAERGYDEKYAEIRARSVAEYQRQITEEWLSERFGEYVNNRYNDALGLSNEVIEFFKYLWERMTLMFSDTDAMQLFEDIYEGRIDYGDITIDLDPSNAGTKFSLLSDEAKGFFNNYDPDNNNIKFGDTFNSQTIMDLKRQGLDDKDLKVGTTRGFVGRGAFLGEIKTVFEDGNRLSFNEIFEGLCTRSAIRSADELSNYIYGRGLVNDFYYLTDENLIELRDTGMIRREGNGYTVTFKTGTFYPASQTVNTKRPFEFTIMLGNSVIFELTNESDSLQKLIKGMPPALRGSDWYQGIIRGIMGRLGDDTSRLESKTQFNHNIAKFLQSNKSQALLDNVSSNNMEIQRAIIALENAVRKGYDQTVYPDFVNLDDDIKDIMKESFNIYLFNQYIPHGAGDDIIKKSLFNRKDQLTLNLINRVNALGSDMVKWEVSEKHGLWNINFEFNLGEKNPRYIGWHMPDDVIQIFEDNGIDIQGHIGNKDIVTLWKKSLISTSPEEYAQAFKNSNVNKKGVRLIKIGNSMRDILETSRPDIFRGQEISFQLQPAIANNTKYVFDNGWKPINLVSDGRHIENVKYINNIHKKYNISIENASPEIQKQLKELRKGSKRVENKTWNAAKHRILNKEYRDLLREKERINTIIEQKKLKEKELQTNVIYQQAKRFQNIIEENPDIIDIMKQVDEGAMVEEKTLALKTEKTPEVPEIEEKAPRPEEITEAEKEVDNVTPSENENAVVDFIKDMTKDWNPKEKDIPNWEECSLNLLEKAKSLDFMMEKYGDDIDYAIENVQMKIMKGEAVDDTLRDMKRIQGKIDTIENDVREGTRERDVDARRESIREQDLGESYGMDTNEAEDRFNKLRDSKRITVDQKYHGLKAENDKLKALIKSEETKWYPSGTFIKSVSEIRDLESIVKISTDKIRNLEGEISNAKGKQRTESLIKEKQRWEYLKEQTKDRMSEVEDQKFREEGEIAIGDNMIDSSNICTL